MAGRIALYRKYRSKSMSEVVGQEHITDVLRRGIERGHISHAYLFTGPRGVGKTSVARILAHDINGLDYDESTTHLDIIEIDAASNRRIDEIRDLREKVHISPAVAKYKVYIIDEVHMLTKEAFNALLKTLEEPPQHAVFILATTEAHKLPATIVSRTQRHTFRPIDKDKVAAHLRTIAEKEKIDISDEALALLAAHGEGSFRDSISMLDQVSQLSSAIDEETVERMLGIAPIDAISDLWSHVAAGRSPEVITSITDLYKQGVSASAISLQLIKQELSRSSNQRELELASRLLEVSASSHPDVKLEIILLSYAPNESSQQKPKLKETQLTENQPTKPADENQTAHKKSPDARKETSVAVKDEKIEEKNRSTPDSEEPVGHLEVTGVMPEDSWHEVLAKVKAKNNSLYSILRMAEPNLARKNVVLKFKFPFHVKRASETKHRDLLMNILSEIQGEGIELDLIHDANAKPPEIASVEIEPQENKAAPETTSKESDNVNANKVIETFGGGEVVSI